MSAPVRALTSAEERAFRLARLVAAELAPYFMHALFAATPWPTTPPPTGAAPSRQALNGGRQTYSAHQPSPGHNCCAPPYAAPWPTKPGAPITPTRDPPGDAYPAPCNPQCADRP
jgi:hypothetical protein